MKKILALILLGSLITCGKSTDSPGYQYFDDTQYSPSIKSYDVECDTHITCRDIPEGTIPYKEDN
jgi:hypothetical protein